MFERLISLLSGPAPEPIDPEDTQTVLAALLVRIAKVDRAYLFEEIRTIDSILASRFGGDALTAAKLRAQGERLEAMAPATERFAEQIRSAVSHEDRVALGQAMWQVMMADGVRRPEEARLVALAESILGVAVHEISTPDA